MMTTETEMSLLKIKRSIICARLLKKKSRQQIRADLLASDTAIQELASKQCEVEAAMSRVLSLQTALEGTTCSHEAALQEKEEKHMETLEHERDTLEQKATEYKEELHSLRQSIFDNRVSDPESALFKGKKKWRVVITKRCKRSKPSTQWK